MVDAADLELAMDRGRHEALLGATLAAWRVLTRLDARRHTTRFSLGGSIDAGPSRVDGRDGRHRTDVASGGTAALSDPRWSRGERPRTN
jgi:hypothetical protein